jgi:hypothetical protein
VTPRAGALRGLASLIALVAAGCVGSPERYRYQPPIPIATSDWDACHDRANATALRGYRRYVEIVEAAGPFGGPFGGVTLAQKAWNEREATYAREMTECLTGRGYEVRTPGSERDSR